MKNALIGGTISFLLLAGASVAPAEAQELDRQRTSIQRDAYSGTYDMFVGTTGPSFDAEGRVTSSNGIINPPMITVSIQRVGRSLYRVTRTTAGKTSKRTTHGIARLVERRGSALPEGAFHLQGRKTSGLLAEGKLLVRWLDGDDAKRLDNGVLDMAGAAGRLAGQTSKPAAPTFDGMDPLASTAEYRFLSGRIEGTLTSYEEDEDGTPCAHSTFEQGARRGSHPDVIGTSTGEYLIRPVKASRTKIRLEIRPTSNPRATFMGAYELKRTIGNQQPEIGFGMFVPSKHGPLLVARFVRPRGGRLPAQVRMASYWLHSATGRVVGLEQLQNDGAPIQTAGWKPGAQLLAGKVIDTVVRNATLLPAELMAELHTALKTVLAWGEGVVIRIGDRLCVIGNAIKTAAGHVIRFAVDTTGRLVQIVVDTGQAIHRYVLKPVAKWAHKVLTASYELVRDAATGAWRLVLRTAVGVYEFVIRPVAKAGQAAIVSAYQTWVGEVRRADGKLDGKLGE